MVTVICKNQERFNKAIVNIFFLKLLVLFGTVVNQYPVMYCSAGIGKISIQAEFQQSGEINS